MKGQVLEFSVQTNSGLISGEDGARYSFSGSEWHSGSSGFPTAGMRVDFEIYEDIAVEVFPDTQSQVSAAVVIKGRVLDYSVQTNSGLISGDDGVRYSFSGTDWRGNANVIPSAGTDVEFTTTDGVAVGIYPTGTGVSATPFRPTSPPSPNYGKSKVTAGVLAILLGGLGIHKFYLGYTKQGWLILAASFISLIMWAIVIGVFCTLAIGVIAFIEGIIYLTKSDYEFYQTYVANKKKWF